MADDVAITAGTGTSIATDDVGGAHVQLFKLAYSADGSRVLVPADGDGLAVKVHALVSDASDTAAPGAVAPLSLTTDGRLRVMTVSESYNMSPWGSPTDWGSDGIGMDSFPLSGW